MGETEQVNEKCGIENCNGRHDGRSYLLVEFGSRSIRIPLCDSCYTHLRTRRATSAIRHYILRSVD